MDYHGKQGDIYHQVRHKEIFNNKELLKNWGDYAEHKYFSRIKNDARILEIGAGTGVNMVTVKNRVDVTIVEPSDFARSHCASIGLRSYKTLADIPGGQQFDFIFMRHVLEHLKNPFEMLSSLKKWLNSDGIVMIIVPIESGHKKYNKADLDHHLFCWNPQTLHNLLEECGFKVNRLFVNSFDGRRIFAGIKKRFGSRMYFFLMELLGTLLGKSEIVIEASCRTTLKKKRA